MSGTAALPLRVTPAAAARSSFWYRFRQTRLAMAGLVVVVALALVALLAPVIAPYDPARQTLAERLAGPSARHWLGMDELGRDLLSRLIYGAQISMTAGSISVGIGIVSGVPLGLIAGYVGGRVDQVIMRIMDGLLSLPSLVLALAITAALGPELRNALLAIGIASMPVTVRLTRAQTLALRSQLFIEAARSIGAPGHRIMLRHLLPNAAGPLIVHFSLTFAAAMLAEASLSFLGLGAQPPTPSWGAMVSAGKNFIQLSPLISVAPGLAIFVSVLGFNLVGDGLRDALDPRLMDR